MEGSLLSGLRYGRRSQELSSRSRHALHNGFRMESEVRTVLFYVVLGSEVAISVLSGGRTPETAEQGIMLVALDLG